MGHRATLYNDTAEQEFFETFGEETWTGVVGDIESTPNAPQRHIYGDTGNVERSVLLSIFLTDIPIQDLSAGFKESLEVYRRAGITAFGSRLAHPLWIRSFYDLMRRNGRLPIRFGYTLEVHDGMISTEFATSLYPRIGPQWETMDFNPWFYQLAVSSEGAWDSVQRACLGPDLEAVSQEKKAEEKCPEPDERGYRALKSAIGSGYKLTGVHGVGSDGIRRFIQMVEDAISENPQLTREAVQEMGLGLAHGTMAGKPSVVEDDLFEQAKDLNIFVPINVGRALRDEPATVIDRYGEEALEFLAPVKSLLDADVNVVGESEHFMREGADPTWYFEVVNAYVNRFTAKEKSEPEAGDTDVWVPEEGIDRVKALKLITIRSAEFLAAEEFIGSLEIGKFADFVVIENDVLQGPKDRLRNNKIIMVGVNGEIEHQADEAKNDISIEEPDC